MTPYYSDSTVDLYLGDCRELLPELDRVDCVVTDPPYGSTTLEWDRWPEGWVQAVARIADSMWMFASMRLLLTRSTEMLRWWHFAQDVIWEKHNGSSFASDRFKRVHETATHWYRGPWGGTYHRVPRVPRTGPAKSIRNRTPTPHTGAITGGVYEDDGTRLTRSVLRAHSMHGKAIHPTEKPVSILARLIQYSCPPDGLVLDPFAGSGSTGEAAQLCGRRAVLIEADERSCAIAARRLEVAKAVSA